MQPNTLIGHCTRALAPPWFPLQQLGAGMLHAFQEVRSVCMNGTVSIANDARAVQTVFRAKLHSVIEI